MNFSLLWDQNILFLFESLFLAKLKSITKFCYFADKIKFKKSFRFSFKMTSHWRMWCIFPSVSIKLSINKWWLLRIQKHEKNFGQKMCEIIVNSLKILPKILVLHYLKIHNDTTLLLESWWTLLFKFNFFGGKKNCWEIQSVFFFFSCPSLSR